MKRLISPVLAEWVPMPQVHAVFGISRSRAYRLAAERKILLRKLGHRTLVDAASVRAFMATLPIASTGKATTAS